MKSLKLGSIDNKVERGRLKKNLRMAGIGLATLVIGSAFILNAMGIANVIMHHYDPKIVNGRMMGYSLMEGPFVQKTIEFNKYGPGTVEITRQNLMIESSSASYLDIDDDFDVDYFVSPDLEGLDLFSDKGGFSKVKDKEKYPEVYEKGNDTYKQMFSEFLPYIY